MARLLMLLAPIALITLSGCASIAVTLASLGAGVGTNQYLGSVSYRTFTEPLPAVRQAALTSIVRMKIDLEDTERTENGSIIRGKTSSRDIEIDLEAITENSTRMRAIARHDNGLFLDRATANEIVAQTERALASANASAMNRRETQRLPAAQFSVPYSNSPFALATHP